MNKREMFPVNAFTNGTVLSKAGELEINGGEVNIQQTWTFEQDGDIVTAVGRLGEPGKPIPIAYLGNTTIEDVWSSNLNSVGNLTLYSPANIRFDAPNVVPLANLGSNLGSATLQMNQLYAHDYNLSGDLLPTANIASNIGDATHQVLSTFTHDVALSGDIMPTANNASFLGDATHQFNTVHTNDVSFTGDVMPIGNLASSVGDAAHRLQDLYTGNLDASGVATITGNLTLGAKIQTATDSNLVLKAGTGAKSIFVEAANIVAQGALAIGSIDSNLTLAAPFGSVITDRTLVLNRLTDSAHVSYADLTGTVMYNTVMPVSGSNTALEFRSTASAGGSATPLKVEHTGVTVTNLTTAGNVSAGAIKSATDANLTITAGTSGTKTLVFAADRIQNLTGNLVIFGASGYIDSRGIIRMCNSLENGGQQWCNVDGDQLYYQDYIGGNVGNVTLACRAYADSGSSGVMSILQANVGSRGMYKFHADVVAGTATTCLGSNSDPGAFADCYLKNAVTIVSDERFKTIAEGTFQLSSDFVHSLQPIEFVWKEQRNVDSTGEDLGPVTYTRTHMGFSAQQLKTSIESQGLDPSDIGAWCLADPSNVDSKQMIRYEELIPPLYSALQHADVHVTFESDGSCRFTDAKIISSGSRIATGRYQVNHTLGRAAYVQITVMGTDAVPLLAELISNDGNSIVIRVFQWANNYPADALQLHVHLR